MHQDTIWQTGKTPRLRLRPPHLRYFLSTSFQRSQVHVCEQADYDRLSLSGGGLSDPCYALPPFRMAGDSNVWAMWDVGGPYDIALCVPFLAMYLERLVRSYSLANEQSGESEFCYSYSPNSLVFEPLEHLLHLGFEELPVPMYPFVRPPGCVKHLIGRSDLRLGLSQSLSLCSKAVTHA
jgi:hypothetical protein